MPGRLYHHTAGLNIQLGVVHHWQVDHCRTLVRQQAGDIGDWNRATEKVALAERATTQGEGPHRLDILDAFGDGRHIEAFREPENGLDDLLALGIALHRLNEGSIDLELVELHLAEMVQARVARPEVVQRDLDARGLKRRQGLLGRRDIADQGRLRHLHLETAGLKDLGHEDLKNLRGWDYPDFVALPHFAWMAAD